MGDSQPYLAPDRQPALVQTPAQCHEDLYSANPRLIKRRPFVLRWWGSWWPLPQRGSGLWPALCSLPLNSPGSSARSADPVSSRAAEDTPFHPASLPSVLSTSPLSPALALGQGLDAKGWGRQHLALLSTFPMRVPCPCHLQDPGWLGGREAGTKHAACIIGLMACVLQLKFLLHFLAVGP